MLTGMKFQADQQDLRHDQPRCLEALAEHHVRHPRRREVDLAKGRDSRPDGDRSDCRPQGPGWLLQSRNEKSHHCDDWRECLRSGAAASQPETYSAYRLTACHCDDLRECLQLGDAASQPEPYFAYLLTAWQAHNVFHDCGLIHILRHSHRHTQSSNKWQISYTVHMLGAEGQKYVSVLESHGMAVACISVCLSSGAQS